MTHPRIHRDPDIMAGKPCIRGTRITVELLLREVSGGSSFTAIAEAYGIASDDVAAAVAYAADYIGHESLIAA